MTTSHKSDSRGIKEFFPVYLWIASFPFGIATQNIVSGLVFLCLILKFIKLYFLSPQAKSGLTLIDQKQYWLVSLMTGFILWTCIATWLNPGSTVTNIFKFPPGYLLICFGPFLISNVYGQFSPSEWKKFARLTGVIVFIWGLVAISQYLFSWRVQGSRFIIEEANRPRGFYSHPLTFAYASFFFWPLSVLLTIKNSRNITSWLLFSGSGLCILLTQSRTIQAVAAMILLWNLWTHLKGKMRAALLLVLLAGSFSMFFVPNPVSEKFINTFNSKGVDLHSQYPDDRLAFWHVHWMIGQERPITGHGFQLNMAYRLPYYEKIGLEGFVKPYEAHNMYLQIWCNSGLIGLILFLIWVLWQLHLFYKTDRHPSWFRHISIQTLSGFLLVSLTQNAFQDASVRMILTMFLSACWLVVFARPIEPHSKKEVSMV